MAEEDNEQADDTDEALDTSADEPSEDLLVDADADDDVEVFAEVADVFESDDDDDAAATTTEDDEEEEAAEGDDAAEATATTRKKKVEEEEDDDDEMLAPDDVEADLDRILKDRMVTSDEQDDDDDDDTTETAAPERGDDSGRLQPKRSDEVLCSSCFLLVRTSAPGCPVGDDACPVFS
ncbi:MAG: hypothetical protein M3Q72_12970 [Actinomycetota bacterium]|nr:hypothetical protein [Actinomycetota bacterium]